MRTTRLLDLFCKAGGAAKGYQRAGFYVVGVDIEPQPRYAGDEFVQADALTFPLGGFDAIHASPPCQAHTSMRTMHNAREHADLIAPMRRRLIAAGVPWAIENVVGAPLVNPITLCGTMFCLGVTTSGYGTTPAELRRHRLFETSVPVAPLHCLHNASARTIGIYGEGVRDARRKYDKTIPEFTVTHARTAMGIDWMTLAELCQAIPPAYTEYVGAHLMTHLRAERAA